MAGSGASNISLSVDPPHSKRMCNRARRAARGSVTLAASCLMALLLVVLLHTRRGSDSTIVCHNSPSGDSSNNTNNSLFPQIMMALAKEKKILPLSKDKKEKPQFSLKGFEPRDSSDSTKAKRFSRSGAGVRKLEELHGQHSEQHFVERSTFDEDTRQKRILTTYSDDSKTAKYYPSTADSLFDESIAAEIPATISTRPSYSGLPALHALVDGATTRSRLLQPQAREKGVEVEATEAEEIPVQLKKPEFSDRYMGAATAALDTLRSYFTQAPAAAQEKRTDEKPAAKLVNGSTPRYYSAVPDEAFLDSSHELPAFPAAPLDMRKILDRMQGTHPYLSPSQQEEVENHIKWQSQQQEVREQNHDDWWFPLNYLKQFVQLEHHAQQEKQDDDDKHEEDPQQPQEDQEENRDHAQAPDVPRPFVPPLDLGQWLTNSMISNNVVFFPLGGATGVVDGFGRPLLPYPVRFPFNGSAAAAAVAALNEVLRLQPRTATLDSTAEAAAAAAALASPAATEHALATAEKMLRRDSAAAAATAASLQEHLPGIPSSIVASVESLGRPLRLPFSRS